MWYRNSGWLLVAIGCLHNLVGLVLGWDILAAMAAEGWWNTVEADGVLNAERNGLLWFLLLGGFWWILGALMQAWLARWQVLPRWLGCAFFAAGGITVLVLPQSGAWLFFPLALLLLMATDADQTQGAAL